MMKKRSSAGPRSKDARARFLGSLAQYASVAHACRAAGVDRKTAYEWRRDDPAFAQEWESAVSKAVDALEAIAIERAAAGSDGVLMFLLKAHSPKYRDSRRHELSGPGGGGIPFQIFNASDVLAEITSGSGDESQEA